MLPAHREAASRADARERPRAARSGARPAPGPSDESSDGRRSSSSSFCSSAAGRARVFSSDDSCARGRHSGAARLPGAPCATSPVSTGTRSASGTSPSPRNTSRGTCRGARRPTTTTTRSPSPRRDGVGATTNIRPPNDPPRQGAPRRARPLEPSRLETRRRRRGARGRSARARLVPRRRRRPTRPQEESTRRPRARRPSRRAPAHRPASPSAAPRPRAASGVLDPRARPRAAASQPPSLFAATRARQTAHLRATSTSSSPSSSCARAFARGLHLVGHLRVDRWGAHVAVIPVREHPDDPAPTALVLAGSKGLRSQRARALSTRGSTPDRWGHAHTILSPITHPYLHAFPLWTAPSRNEEVTRVSLLPWSVARTMGVDRLLGAEGRVDAPRPEGFASRVALTSRLNSGAFGGYVELRVASDANPLDKPPLMFYASRGGGGAGAGGSSRTIFDAAASPRTGRIVAGTDAGVATFRPWTDTAGDGRPEMLCRCGSDVTAVAADVSCWLVADATGAGGGRGAAEIIAAGTRNGGVALVDTRDARRCVRDGGGRMSSLVCDLAAVRSHPGHVLAASADGGLARWDVRRASEPVTTYRAGSKTATFCATRRFAVDESETVVVMDGARTTPGTRGVPGSARDVECVTMWDLRGGKSCGGTKTPRRRGRGRRCRRRRRRRRPRRGCGRGGEIHCVCSCRSRCARGGGRRSRRGGWRRERRPQG